MLLAFSCVVLLPLDLTTPIFSQEYQIWISDYVQTPQLTMAVILLYFLHRANGPSSFMTCLIASFTCCSVLRLAVKLLLLSSFISWQPTIIGSWWRGCTYIASSSWPSSLTRTTCGPSLSSAGVNSITDAAVTGQANSDWTDNTIFLFADVRCSSCVRVHLGQCPSITGRHAVSQWMGSTIVYLQDTHFKNTHSFSSACRCWDISAGNLKWIYQVPILAAIVVRNVDILTPLKDILHEYLVCTLYPCRWISSSLST